MRGVVVDVGAGAGSFIDPASTQAVSDCHPARLIHVDDASLEPRSDTVQRLRADLDAGLPLADAAVDAAICSHVLEHLRQGEHLLADLARVLRSGGWLIVAVPNGSALSDRLFRIWYRVTHLRGGRYRGHVRRWTLASITAAMRDAGFDLQAVTRIGESYSWLHKHRLARRMLLALHTHNRRFGPDFFAYGWHLVARKRLNATAPRTAAASP